MMILWLSVVLIWAGRRQEISGERRPLLIDGDQHFESFSLPAAALPFLFPALGGFLYGYDIGSTSCATVSVKVISLFLLGSFYTFLDDVPVLEVVALLLYVGCYQAITPVRARIKYSSACKFWGKNATVTFAFSPLKELQVAGISFFIFGGIAVSSLLFIYFIVPETKGLALEEIEANLL